MSTTQKTTSYSPIQITPTSYTISDTKNTGLGNYGDWVPLYEGHELMGYQNHKQDLHVVLDTKQRPPSQKSPSDFLGPVLAVFLIGRDTIRWCRKNRASHFGNEKTSGNYKTINPDRSMMGSLEKSGIRSLQKQQISMNGMNLEITFYPRAGGSAAQITGGPSDVVGLKVSNLSCLQRGWKEKATDALGRQIINQQQKRSAATQAPIIQKVTVNELPPLEPRKTSAPNPATPKEPQNNPQDKAVKKPEAKATENSEQKSAPKIDQPTPPEPQKNSAPDPLTPKEPQNNPKDQTPKTLKGRVLDFADKASQASKEKADSGRSLMNDAKQNSEIAQKNKAKMEKPGQTAEKVAKYKDKYERYNKKSRQQHNEGLKKAVPNRAKEKGYAEVKNQVSQINDTVKQGAAFNATDAVLDYLEGKYDASTAAQNTIVNTATGTVTQIGSSVVYETVKGALSETCPQVAEYLPGLGTTMQVLSAGSTYYSAKTREEGLWGLADIGGELATVAAVGAVISTAGVTAPVIVVGIGGKVAWRGMKWGYAYFSAPSSNPAARAAISAVTTLKQS